MLNDVRSKRIDESGVVSAGTKMTNPFDIPNTLRIEETPNGLLRAVVTTPEAEAKLYLQGAHLSDWTPRGQRPILFLSSRSLYARSKAIRGGVPVIFPWFGARGDGKSGPAHGFARSMEWQLEETTLKNDGRVEITLVLRPNDITRSFGFDKFHLRFRVAIGSQLAMELETHNEANETLVYEEALHTYFAVSDVRQCRVSGLEGTTYIDKTDGFKQKNAGAEAIQITKETDQVHLNTRTTCRLHDPIWNRQIVVEKNGSDSTVVWNPWVEKTQGMSDMAPDDWKQMICIETANAGVNAMRLPAGASHKLTTSMRVE
jgi:glucose-6-phosphate 1-epimerase